MVTREFHDFKYDDWIQNSAWFGNKLLVDVYAQDYTKEMQNHGYSKDVRSVLQCLGIECADLLHLGRKLGGKMAEFFNARKEEITALGNWKRDIFDTNYSSQLPMNAIRTLAGSDPNMYYLPRGSLPVPEALLQATPIGEWSYAALEEVHERADAEKRTVRQVLRLFCRLNEIFLQDAAVLMLEMEKDADGNALPTHSFFQKVPVLNCEAFKVRIEFVKPMSTPK